MTDTQTYSKQLSNLVGFEVPLHDSFTQSFGREIIDFVSFTKIYRDTYGKSGKKIYEDIKERFGLEALNLIDELT